MNDIPIGRRFVAELIGTFWLVFGGIGSAILAAHFLSSDPSPVNMGIGFLGVGLAVGLTVMTMAFAIGHVSGCHLNPAVSIGLCVGGRIPAKDLVPYIFAQLIGGLIGGGLIFFFVMSTPGSDAIANGFGCNGYGDHSPGHYPMIAAMVGEIVLTAVFLFVIMGATDQRAPAGFAPIAIGLCLTLIHLVGIPIDNLSVNPARSLGTAVFELVGGQNWAIQQVWLFFVGPILGGAIGAGIYKTLCPDTAKITS